MTVRINKTQRVQLADSFFVANLWFPFTDFDVCLMDFLYNGLLDIQRSRQTDVHCTIDSVTHILFWQSFSSFLYFCIFLHSLAYCFESMTIYTGKQPASPSGEIPIATTKTQQGTTKWQIARAHQLFFFNINHTQ